MEKFVRALLRCCRVGSAILILMVGSACAQTSRVPAKPVDSLSVILSRRDSLRIADSIYTFREQHSNQLATMRLFDMNGDGKGETLRLDGTVKPNVADILLTFTIRSGRKLLWKQSWKAGGYFDPSDRLPDTIKLQMLRRIVSKFFSNENFSVVDSVSLRSVFRDATPLDVKRDSKEMHSIAESNSVVFNVYQSRDLFYGLTWSRIRGRFVRIWRN